ncbi:MAG TPA: nicotinamide riboside transporter PnuC [Steroidobacteraceae bacterium]|nr:nicotinamide riboside transporter PnuC [Steroidobacteraceae bacterium]
MTRWLSSIVEFFAFSSAWELVAVLLALAYLLLAVKRSLWCWLAALISSAIYLVLMLQVKLYMQTALQVFYLGMAIYGFVEWRKGRDAAGEVVIARWKAATHVYVIGAVFAVSALNGWLLARNTDAAWPYLDAFVTWGSVVTTVMVARRVIENWLYWIVVDGVAAYLYFRQGLNPTAVLFVVYIGIVIHGFWVWRREARAAREVASR